MIRPTLASSTYVSCRRVPTSHRALADFARQFPDVNAFLTLAATRHRWSADDLHGRPRTGEIIAAAKAGRVSVKLVSSCVSSQLYPCVKAAQLTFITPDLSEKNPLEVLPHDATIISLLRVFSKGTHRGGLRYMCSCHLRLMDLPAPVLIKAPPPSNEYLGMVSDRSLLEWFTLNARKTPSLEGFLSTSLNNLALPSISLYSAVIATKASDTVLDAMRLMSDYGVSSVAVLQEEGGGLLSAVSVTDIGKVRP